MTAPARIAALALFAGVMCGPVMAQDGGDTAVNQMNTAPRGQATATEAAQISRTSADRAIAPAERSDRRLTGSGPTAPGPISSLQLSREEATADVGPQVSRAPGGVGPAPSAEARAAGRVTAVVRPQGPDRCDPQGGRPLPPACEHVIEARASDFPAPDPHPLSPEQRLLVAEREMRSTSQDAGTAARRLGNGEIDDQTAAMALASSTLPNRDARPDEEDAPGELNPALDAIVAGITTLVTGAPPTP